MTERNAEPHVGTGGGPERKVPNAETRAAMAEADEIVKAGRARFASAEDMFEALEETGHPGHEDK